MDISGFQKFYDKEIRWPPKHLYTPLDVPRLDSDLHMLLGGIGVSEESAEVLEVTLDTTQTWHFARLQIINELGDVLWYCALVANTCRISLESCMPLAEEILAEQIRVDYPDIQFLGSEMSAERLCVAAKGLSGYIKKYVFRRPNITAEQHLENVADRLAAVLLQLSVSCALVGASIEEVAETQIAKTENRHSDGIEKPHQK